MRRRCGGIKVRRLPHRGQSGVRRGDALEKRRALMNDWAAYIEAVPGANVVPLRPGRAGAGA